MRERNILKRLDGKYAGWIVGLNDHNNIIVQAPTGEKGPPTEQSGRRWTIDGGLSDAAVSESVLNAVEIPEAVMHFVHVAWEKQDQAAMLAAREEAEVEEEEEEPEPNPTLRDLGFDGNPRVDSF
jgi:hypothetical protein